MIINEVNSLLNRICSISFRDGDKLVVLSGKHDFYGIAKLRVKDKSAFVITNIPKNQDLSESALNDIRALKLKETEESFLGKWDVADPETVELFQSLISISSVVIDTVIVHGGKRTIIFRYHDTDQQKVSAILLAPKKFSMFQVNLMAENAALKHYRDFLPENFQLNYYELTMSVPPSSMDIKGDYVIATFGNNWYREVKYLLNDSIQAVYYEKSNLISRPKELTSISDRDRIYEMTFRNPLVSYVFDKTAERLVAILGMLHSMIGKNFTMGVIIPSCVANEFHGIIAELAGSFPDWKINLTHASEIL